MTMAFAQRKAGFEFFKIGGDILLDKITSLTVTVMGKAKNIFFKLMALVYLGF